MGYTLHRELRDALGPDITPLQRLVALQIAIDADDATRETPISVEKLTRWCGAKDENVVRNALKRLAAAGWEFRVPIGKGKDGRKIYAMPGHALHFRVPDPPEGVAPATPYVEQGVAGAPSQRAPAPSKRAGATPLLLPSTSIDEISPEAALVRAACVVREEEEREFIEWIKETHKPKSLAWWRKVASEKGDLAVLAERWREYAADRAILRGVFTGTATVNHTASKLIECKRCFSPIRPPVHDSGLCRQCREEAA